MPCTFVVVFIPSLPQAQVYSFGVLSLVIVHWACITMAFLWATQTSTFGRIMRFFVVITAFFIIRAYLGRQFYPSVALTTSTIDIQTDYPLATAKILRVSMLYGLSNSLYERAINTLRKHARRWNHDFQVLREDLVSGFWNKPTYLLYSITQELIKPANDRAEWLM